MAHDIRCDCYRCKFSKLSSGDIMFVTVVGMFVAICYLKYFNDKPVPRIQFEQ